MFPDDFSGALDDLGVDLAQAARQGNLPPVLFRDEEIRRALTALDGGRSVLIVGVHGAGKTAVIGGIAHLERDPVA